MFDDLTCDIRYMFKKLAAVHPHDWDKRLLPILASYREIPIEDLGFSPYQLLHGRSPRGEVTILRDLFSEENLDEEVRGTYRDAIRIQGSKKYNEVFEKSALRAETKRKVSFSKRGQKREIEKGDKVLILLPTSTNKLVLEWRGPFEVDKRMSKVDFGVNVENCVRVFHTNRMKKYDEQVTGIT